MDRFFNPDVGAFDFDIIDNSLTHPDLSVLQGDSRI